MSNIQRYRINSIFPELVRDTKGDIYLGSDVDPLLAEIALKDAVIEAAIKLDSAECWETDTAWKVFNKAVCNYTIAKEALSKLKDTNND